MAAPRLFIAAKSKAPPNVRATAPAHSITECNDGFGPHSSWATTTICRTTWFAVARRDARQVSSMSGDFEQMMAVIPPVARIRRTTNVPAPGPDAQMDDVCSLPRDCVRDRSRRAIKGLSTAQHEIEQVCVAVVAG
jgi:hypothetical protein